MMEETDGTVTEWNSTVCGLPEELQGPINDKSHVRKCTHTRRHKFTWLGLKVGERLAFKWNSAAGKDFFFFGWDSTPQHRSLPKVWSNHRLLNVLNIGGLIGSVEKWQPGSAGSSHIRTHPHCHVYAHTYLDTIQQFLENRRKLTLFQSIRFPSASALTQ